MGKTALIAGSTGLTGRLLLRKLLADQAYEKVFSIVRTNTDEKNPKLVELIIDFNQFPFSLQDIKQVDDIFCCLGTTMKKAGSKDEFRKVDYEYPFKLATWGREIHAKHFLCISAMGANPSSGLYYNKVKGEMERDISLIDLPATTFFRPSLLLGERVENRVGERIAVSVMKLFSFIFIGPIKNYKAIDAEKVAEAMMRAAHSPPAGTDVLLSGEMNK